MAGVAWAVLTVWPAHGSYEIRMRVGYSLQMAGSVRNAVSLFWERTGRLPASVSDLPEGIPTFARDLVIVESTGRVTLRLAAPKLRELDGKQIIFTPTVPVTKQEPLRWQCSSPDVDSTYLPHDCRG